MAEKRIKVRKWLRDQLNNKWRSGYGKSKNKGIHNETPYIHSENTYNTYLAQCNHFADWCMANGIKYANEAYLKVAEYGEWMADQGKSAWTIHTAIAAIAKAYGVSTTKFGYTAPKRERMAVKRSRYAAERDRHFSVSNNKELIVFASCTGLRRHELESLHGNQLTIGENGQLQLFNIKGKGGKVRTIDIIGSEAEIELIKKRMALSGAGLVFSHVHSAFDEHYYRSIYACRAYKSKARPVEDIPDKDKYICRKDKAGIIYDRRAMLYASMQLGHNRIDVIANSYLHNL